MDRDRLWRVTGPRVRTIAQASRFIRDVGFAHLFPGKTPGPSLWAATTERPDPEVLPTSPSSPRRTGGRAAADGDTFRPAPAPRARRR